VHSLLYRRQALEYPTGQRGAAACPPEPVHIYVLHTPPASPTGTGLQRVLQRLAVLHVGHLPIIPAEHNQNRPSLTASCTLPYPYTTAQYPDRADPPDESRLTSGRRLVWGRGL
jgi:hypothetical protein